MAVPCEQVMSQKPSVPTESGQPRTLPKKALLVLLLLQLQHKRSWGLPAIKQGCLLLAPGVLHALPLLLLEVDQFEGYIEVQGSQAGDEILRIVAACVQGRPRRATDIAARYGGEVFAVLMPHTDGFGAMMMAEQVRNAVLDRILPHPGSPCGVLTVSIGVATLTPSHDKIPAALVGRAGVALAEAGRLGSNRIEADAAVVAAAATAAGWFDGPAQAGIAIDG